MSTRLVTLEGTVQLTSLTPESVIREAILWNLQSNAGVGVAELAIEQGWFSTLSTVTITVAALSSQSQSSVQQIVTQAFRNISAANPDTMWNVGSFVITNWPAAQPEEGIGGGYDDGGLIDIGNFDGGTVYGGSTPGTTATGGNNTTPTTGTPAGAKTSFEKTMDELTAWLKAHQTEAMLGGLILVVLITRK